MPIWPACPSSQASALQCPVWVAGSLVLLSPLDWSFSLCILHKFNSAWCYHSTDVILTFCFYSKFIPHCEPEALLILQAWEEHSVPPPSSPNAIFLGGLYSDFPKAHKILCYSSCIASGKSHWAFHVAQGLCGLWSSGGWMRMTAGGEHVWGQPVPGLWPLLSWSEHSQVCDGFRSQGSELAGIHPGQWGWLISHQVLSLQLWGLWGHGWLRPPLYSLKVKFSHLKTF